ncbi:MAG TPA: regulatory protein RecX [Gammaproteobacteria bacterium]|nr:regulatory protein RecX [Gammaproteobacteria bacterium]
MSLSKPKKPEGDEASDPARIRAAALDFLARREHSAGEITAKLLARGYDRDAVATVVAALASGNLLSDVRFVEEFVASRLRRGSGPAKIREELRGRGVDGALVDSALAEYADAWVENAAAARRKRFGAALPRDYAERARQARFLQQRGFSAEQVRRVLKGDIDD